MLQNVARRAVSKTSEPNRRCTLAFTGICAIATILFTLSLATVARARSRGPAGVGQGEPEAQIHAVLDAQVTAWNRGDVAAFMQGYWNSPDTEFVGSNGIVRGWQLILDRYRKAYPDRAAMGHLEFSDLEIQMLGSDAALVVGRFHLQRQSDTPRGVFTLVFRKFPEGWRIIHDHTSATALQ